MASRFSLGSVDGPLGTAQDFRTPAASRRTSQCIEVASCCWITNRGAPRRDRPRRPAGSGVLRRSRFRRYSWSKSFLGVTMVAYPQVLAGETERLDTPGRVSPPSEVGSGDRDERRSRMAAERTARAVWRGNLLQGSGEVSTESTSV